MSCKKRTFFKIAENAQTRVVTGYFKCANFYTVGESLVGLLFCL